MQLNSASNGQLQQSASQPDLAALGRWSLLEIPPRNSSFPNKIRCDSLATRKLLKALDQLPRPTDTSVVVEMRFQQKLQKEQEQKRNELISPTAGTTPGYYRTTTTTVTTSNGHNGSGSGGSSGNGGKVRQLFEERRQRGIGIDKSYPLQPIQTTTTTTKRTSTLDNGRTSQKGLPFSSNRTTTVTSTRPVATMRTLTTTSKYGTPTTTTLVMGAADPNNNQDVTDFRERHGLNGKLAGLSISSEINDNNNNGHLSGGSIKLKPVNMTTSSSSSKSSSARTVINDSPGPVVTRRTTTTTTTTSNNNNGDYPRSPVKTTSSTTKSPVVAAARASPVKKAQSGPPADNMAECRVCGRYFNEDRLEKHETICEKSKTKKRKVFDSTKHRVKGTDAESYVGKKSRSTAASGTKTIAGVVVTKPTAESKKGNWRKKHEEFIAAIRAAKEMKAHLAKGGKLSDLPPPPPSENADYIQCPHCSRRFNEAAATRHIPKCATMLHNKPKPAPAKRRF